MKPQDDELTPAELQRAEDHRERIHARAERMARHGYALKPRECCPFCYVFVTADHDPEQCQKDRKAASRAQAHEYRVKAAQWRR